jgi:glycosyltransferase involved in cell wall biosynthesis
MSEKRGYEDEKTLLVFNCHEPWVYQLGHLGFKLDIIIGLKGRYKAGWDEQMRPVPADARLITLPEAVRSETRYHCIITHNITDLLEVKDRQEPRILVLHSTLEGRLKEEKPQVEARTLKQMVQRYVRMLGAHVVATSMFKGESWGFTEDVVTCGIDAGQYLPCTGERASGIRVCNFINSRRKILLWDFYEEAFAGIPVTLVGHNPDMPGVEASEDWDHLKRLLRCHRFCIHTADPRYEAGYNMASVEAMATGLPILGNCHPSSQIEHGVSGFLSDDPEELRNYAKMLLEDRGLALAMGRQARKTAVEQFSAERFKRSFLRSIETARRKWENRLVRV